MSRTLLSSENLQKDGGRIIGYRTREEANYAEKVEEEIAASSNEGIDTYLKEGDPVTNYETDVSAIQESKFEIVHNALNVVCEKLRVQTAAIFTFSKSGKLERIGIQGKAQNGLDIEKEWYRKESYEVGDTFTGKAVKPEENSKYAKMQYTDNLLNADFGEESTSEYLRKLGSLVSAIAIPLNGRNKTYGVLRVINKIDGGTFNDDDIKHLFVLSIYIGHALSNFRRDVQIGVFKELSQILMQSAYKFFGKNDSLDATYQKVVDLLVKNPETAFKAGILRIENNRHSLKMEAISIAPDVTTTRDNRSLEFNEGLAGKVAANQKRLILQNIRESEKLKEFKNHKWIVENRFESFGCFPLVVKDQSIGTLSLYTGYNYDFYPESVAFVQSIADQLASFVHMVKLERFERELKHQSIPSPQKLLRESRLEQPICVKFPSECSLHEEINLQIKFRALNLQELTSVSKVSEVLEQEQISLIVHITAPGFKMMQHRKALQIHYHTASSSKDAEELNFTLLPVDKGEQIVEIEIFRESVRIGYMLAKTYVTS